MFVDTFLLGIQDLVFEVLTNTRVPGLNKKSIELIQSELMCKLCQMMHIKLATSHHQSLFAPFNWYN